MHKAVGKRTGQKVAKAKVYITLNKAHNGIPSRRRRPGLARTDLGAPFLMSANGQWKRGNKTQVKCKPERSTGQNNTDTDSEFA